MRGCRVVVRVLRRQPTCHHVPGLQCVRKSSSDTHTTPQTPVELREVDLSFLDKKVTNSRNLTKVLVGGTIQRGVMARDYQMAMEAYDNAIQLEVELDEKDYTHILSLCTAPTKALTKTPALTTRLMKAMDVFRSMQKAGYPVRPTHYDMISKVCEP